MIRPQTSESCRFHGLQTGLVSRFPRRDGSRDSTRERDRPGATRRLRRNRSEIAKLVRSHFDVTGHLTGSRRVVSKTPRSTPIRPIGSVSGGWRFERKETPARPQIGFGTCLSLTSARSRGKASLEKGGCGVSGASGDRASTRTGCTEVPRCQGTKMPGCRGALGLVRQRWIRIPRALTLRKLSKKSWDPAIRLPRREPQTMS